MQRSVRSKSGLAAPLSLPAGFAALLVLGAAAALAGGQLPATGVMTEAAVIVAAACAVAELAAAPLLALAGWLTAVGFSGPPYGQLRPAGPLSIPALGIIGGGGRGRRRLNQGVGAGATWRAARRIPGGVRR